MPSPPNYDEWPPWAKEAEQDMLESGVPPEVVLTKALLLGIKIEPFSPQDYTHSKYVTCIARNSDEVGLLGITPEHLAHRWMVQCHPLVLRELKRQRGERPLTAVVRPHVAKGTSENTNNRT